MEALHRTRDVVEDLKRLVKRMEKIRDDISNAATLAKAGGHINAEALAQLEGAFIKAVMCKQALGEAVRLGGRSR